MIRNLGEVCTFYSGTGFPVEYQGKTTGELPFFKVGDISNNVSAGYNRLIICGNYISQQDAAMIRGTVLPKDTVVFAKIGEALKLNRRAITNCPCLIDNNVMGIAPKQEYLRVGYFFYYMQHLKMQDYAESTTVPSVRKSKLEQINIYILPIEEQKKIELQLNRVAGIIQKRKQQLSALDDLIKARFVEMFGNPFDARTTIEWPIKSINDLAESISDGSNVDSVLYKDSGDVLFLRIQNVWCNEFRLDDSVFISEAENEKYKDTSLKRGDLLITKIGRYYTADSSLGRVSVYLGEDDKANYSNNIMRVRFREGMSSEFVNALMNLDDYNKFIRRTSVGGTDKRALSKGLIATYPIVVPPLKIQNEFVGFIHQVEKTKVAVQEALDEAQVLFDSLMQQYFG